MQHASTCAPERLNNSSPTTHPQKIKTLNPKTRSQKHTPNSNPILFCFVLILDPNFQTRNFQKRLIENRDSQTIIAGKLSRHGRRRLGALPVRHQRPRFDLARLPRRCHCGSGRALLHQVHRERGFARFLLLSLL